MEHIVCSQYTRNNWRQDTEHIWLNLCCNIIYWARMETLCLTCFACNILGNRHGWRKYTEHDVLACVACNMLGWAGLDTKHRSLEETKLRQV